MNSPSSLARAWGRRHKYKLLTSTTESSDMRQFQGTSTAKFPISPFVTSKSHPWSSNKLLIACKMILSSIDPVHCRFTLKKNIFLLLRLYTFCARFVANA